MSTAPVHRLKVFTWHIHGSYLYYLSQGKYDIYIPVNEQRSSGYYGRGNTFPFGVNVHEIPADAVRDMDFDCILFQCEQNYLVDQYEILSLAQQSLPRIYLEHNAPPGEAALTRHVLTDPDILLVHVTYYNHLMWNNNDQCSVVIEHGVTDSAMPYTGETPRGLVIINHLRQRGRILGWDIFREISKVIPLDLVGMGTEQDGLGEVLHPQLPEFRSRYRFYFHPARHTSLGLSVCEAMISGLPVVGLATTELATVIDNGYTGFIHTNLRYLVDKMKILLEDQQLARRIGEAGQISARERFNIERFVKDWHTVFTSVIHRQLQHVSHQLTTLSV
ncbi:glycosyltransferase family 4 protein [Chitinophaga pendula]|uniref:glycosyltransferase family 4 protein n=1 Tax=Chitinophaga TaxID=79328 RepID=UPI000BAFC156|nr:MULTISPECIES: glycosyltransferase family 4 protein [Chitinophaga]ASZ13827.1 LPS biosynthesis transferase [Chitinophaga sp. MD30]UCJ08550.1 glycosyltransferase family 4 protein [Chitinophaga pendula]